MKKAERVTEHSTWQPALVLLFHFQSKSTSLICDNCFSEIAKKKRVINQKRRERERERWSCGTEPEALRKKHRNDLMICPWELPN